MKTYYCSMLLFILACDAKTPLLAVKSSDVDHSSDAHEPWDGKERIMTRLEREGVVYEFVQISADESVIRLESDKNEVFSKFDRRINDGSARIWNGKLVDVFVEDNEITALISRDSLYRLVTLTSRIPKTPKGSFFIPLKSNSRCKWQLLSHAQFDPEVWVPDDHDVSSAKLVNSKSISFLFRPENGDQEETHVFSIDGRRLLKNQEYICDLPAWNAIISETDLMEQLKNTKSNHLLRQQINQLFGGKEEFIKTLSNYKDKKIHDEIVERVERAFDKPEP